MKQLLVIVRQNYQENNIGWWLIWGILGVLLIYSTENTIRLLATDGLKVLHTLREYSADSAAYHASYLDAGYVKLAILCFSSVMLVGVHYLSCRTQPLSLIYVSITLLLYAVLLNALAYWFGEISLVLRIGGGFTTTCFWGGGFAPFVFSEFVNAVILIPLFL